MAACRQCGTKISSFSFGEQSDYCSTCREQLPAKPKSDFLQDVPESTTDEWLKATQLLLAMNCIVFALMLAKGISPIEPSTDDLIRWGANFGPLTFGGQYWRTLTSGFLHIGIMHIFFNMWCLWRLGNLAERFVGGFNTLAIYLITGFGASLLSLIWDPFRVSAGASGPIFGITGVLVAVLYYGNFNMPPSQVRYLLAYVTRFAFLNLLIGLGGNTDNMAHLGGLVTGLLIGVFLAPSMKIEPKQRALRERVVLIVAVLVLIAIFIPIKKAKGFAVDSFEGQSALERKDYKSAIMYFQRYTSENDQDAYGHAQLGYSLHSMKRYDEAEREYQRALALEPNYPVIQMDLAEIYMIKGKWAEALSLIQKAFPKITPDAEDYKDYGDALAGTNAFSEAEDAYRSAIKLDDKDPDSHLRLAKVLLAEHRTVEANVEHRLAEELSNKNESAVK